MHPDGITATSCTSTSTGAAAQAPHFFNSQPYIIKSSFLMDAAWLLAPDLPYTEGLLSPISLDCPEGIDRQRRAAGAHERRAHPRRLHGQRDR